MTHPSLQMPVERLFLSFLVSRDWYTHIFSQFPGSMLPTIRSHLGTLSQAFLFSVCCVPYCLPRICCLWPRVHPLPSILLEFVPSKLGMKGRVIRRWYPWWPPCQCLYIFHCEFKLGKDICDYSLHTFTTCLFTLFFLPIFHTHVFAHVICSIDLFSVQGATLSQKKRLQKITVNPFLFFELS